MTGIKFEGKLVCYSETGMEGGYLSFQDISFITLSTPVFGVTNDRKVFDKNDKNRYGLSSNTEVLLDNTWLPFPDPICHDQDYRNSSLFRGEQLGDLNADKRLSEKYHFKIKYRDDGTPSTTPSRPYGIPQNGKTRVTVNWNDGSIQHKVLSDDLLIEQWDYKGLHFLKNGDILKIIDPTMKSYICEGQVDKIPLIIFSQTQSGHFELIEKPNNCDWELYFTKNYLAQIIRQQ